MVKPKKNLESLETVTFSDLLKSGHLLPVDNLPLYRLVPAIHTVSARFGYQRVELSPFLTLDAYDKNLRWLDATEDEPPTINLGTTKRFVLRPENFVSMLRTYIEHQIAEREQVTKWYYIEPVFSGSKQSFIRNYEVGWLHLGEASSLPDAQLITMIVGLFEELGLPRPIFTLNNKGCATCANTYRTALLDYLQQQREGLCVACRELVAAATDDQTAVSEPFDVFACLVEDCQKRLAEAPQVIDFLDAPCNRHLTTLLETLDELEILYQLNPRLFGNSIQSHSIFGVKLTEAETPDAHVAIGGRVTKFASKLAGQDVPALAFSLTFDTMFQLLDQNHPSTRPPKTADVFLINLGELAAKKSLRLFLELWKNGITVAEHFGSNGIKNQFKLAETKGCPLALVIGQKEALDGTVILRDVRNGMQEVFSFDRIIEEVKLRLQE